MNATEYRAALARLGLTQVGAGVFLGVGARTSRRWASGESDVPPPVARFLAYLIAAKVSPDEVTRALSDDGLVGAGMEHVRVAGLTGPRAPHGMRKRPQP